MMVSIMSNIELEKEISFMSLLDWLKGKSEDETNDLEAFVKRGESAVAKELKRLGLEDEFPLRKHFEVKSDITYAPDGTKKVSGYCKAVFIDKTQTKDTEIFLPADENLQFKI